MTLDPPSATGAVPLEVRFDAACSTAPDGSGPLTYAWDFGDGGSASESSPAHSYEDPGRYVATLTVESSAGLLSTETVVITAACLPGDVAPWTAADVGEPIFPGSSRREGSAVSLCAGGGGISGAGDECHIVYQERNGDFEITARLGGLEGAGALAGAGLMVRESMAAKARCVALVAEKKVAEDPPTALNLRARYRAVTDGTSATKLLGPIDDYGAAPLWLRLRRKGETVSAFISRSVDWTFAETPDYEMTFTGGPVVVGLAAYGRDGQDATKRYRALRAAFGEVDLSDPVVPGPEFMRADANSDGAVDISDGVFILSYLFVGGPAPTCLDTADADDSAEAASSEGINITDAVYVLNHLFLGGFSPPAPYPGCGVDPTEDVVDCAAYAACE
jgi:PKD repeat protein